MNQACLTTNHCAFRAVRPGSFLIAPTSNLFVTPTKPHATRARGVRQPKPQTAPCTSSSAAILARVETQTHTLARASISPFVPSWSLHLGGRKSSPALLLSSSPPELARTWQSPSLPHKTLPPSRLSPIAPKIVAFVSKVDKLQT